MTVGELTQILQRTLFECLALGGPIILAAMVVGLAISIFQAATQINEATLTFVPKLIVVGAVLMAFGPGMLSNLVAFTRDIFLTAAEVAR
jgi:flagellar biosynthetic protein FliQ